jgi:tryptophan-rich sensory protein
MPAAWVFGAAWTLLYILLGLSLAMVLHARGAKSRQKAVGLFGLQLVLNFAWPPVFFAFHQIEAALSIVAAMIVVGVVTVLVIWRIRVLAGLLLYPYLAWLMFAGMLNYQILALNPNADALAPRGASTDIPL